MQKRKWPVDGDAGDVTVMVVVAAAAVPGMSVNVVARAVTV